MGVIEARFMEHELLFSSIAIVSGVFLAAIAVETVYDYATGRRTNLKESLANGVIEIGNRLLDRSVAGAVFIIGLWIAETSTPLSISVNGWSWILAIIAADFSYYWMHRCEHEVRIFWAIHNTHHSSPEYNLTTSFRLSWLESLFEWIFFVPMVLIGFDLVQTLGALLIVVVYQTWIHTEKVGKLGYLDRVLNTPSTHRVHHGVNPEYIDKNYGGILIIWDRLFGSYEPEREKVTYGITVPLQTANPFTIVFREFSLIIKDIRRARNACEVLGFLFKPPGWQPDENARDNLAEKPKATNYRDGY